MILVGNMVGVDCKTIEEVRLEQERRDIKASGFGLGKKIAVGIGICILCYVWYSWKGDTWGLKKYRDTRIVKHEASADFVKESGSWMYKGYPKNERSREMDMSDIGVSNDTSGIGVPNNMSGIGVAINYDERSLPYFSNRKIPDYSLLSVAGETTEKVKAGDNRSPFKHTFGNLDGDNYLDIDDDNLSGNEVFVSELILQQDNKVSEKLEEQRSSSLVVKSVFGKGVSKVLKNSRRLSVNDKEQAKFKGKNKRSKYKKRREKIKADSDLRPVECRNMTKAEFSKYVVGEKRRRRKLNSSNTNSNQEVVKLDTAKGIADAKVVHRDRVIEYNKKKKVMNPNAKTERFGVNANDDLDGVSRGVGKKSDEVIVPNVKISEEDRFLLENYEKEKLARGKVKRIGPFDLKADGIFNG